MGIRGLGVVGQGLERGDDEELKSHRSGNWVPGEGKDQRVRASGEGGGLPRLHCDSAKVQLEWGGSENGLDEVGLAHRDPAGGDDNIQLFHGPMECGFKRTGDVRDDPQVHRRKPRRS